MPESDPVVAHSISSYIKEEGRKEGKLGPQGGETLDCMALSSLHRTSMAWCKTAFKRYMWERFARILPLSRGGPSSS